MFLADLWKFEVVWNHDKNIVLSLQRLLIVPPELAYGSKGVQEIPPNATIEVTKTDCAMCSSSVFKFNNIS